MSMPELAIHRHSRGDRRAKFKLRKIEKSALSTLCTFEKQHGQRALKERLGKTPERSANGGEGMARPSGNSGAP
jgi:hypothetical protein